MGSDTPKQYLLLKAVPILAWAAAAFQREDIIDEIILVVPEADRAFVAEGIVDEYRLHKVRRIVAGGDTRQDSTASGLRHIGEDPTVVLVHDGVRPFVTGEIIRRAAECACRCQAALVAVPVVDTIKRVNDRCEVIETIPREHLRAAQTPQAFQADVLRRAMRRAADDGYQGTDETVLVERLGIAVPVVAGDAENIKVTTPSDLVRAEQIAAGRDAPC